MTPIQLLNRATDPFLPAVRPRTFAVLELLDERGLRNHVLVITRHAMHPDDAGRLNQLTNLKVTLLFTYSGIEDKRIEPYPSSVAAKSLKLMSAPAGRQYRTVLYWRPLVPGLNDTDAHLNQAHALSQHADATVFTGLFYRDQIAAYYRANGLPEPYSGTAGVLPEARDLTVVQITQRAAVLAGLPGEQPRYYLQHALGFQMHDVNHPHHARRHGRADIGWKESPRDD
jgi:hypothetical protein